MSDRAQRFLMWLLVIDVKQIIRVKSWRPFFGRFGVEWPTLLVDSKHGQRQTITPVWDRNRIVDFFRRTPQ